VDLLGFVGFALDDEANAVHGKAMRGRITRTTSPMAAVIATNEELMIAMDTAEIIRGTRQLEAA
jgi:acetate kinase